MIKLDLSYLGIIQGDNKRALEDYVDPSYFKQRKSYDEYTIDKQYVFVFYRCIGDLMLLAENFKVIVYQDSVCLEEKGL